MLRTLLASGAQALAFAQDDMNALHFAAQKGHTEICRLLLLQKGAHQHEVSCTCRSMSCQQKLTACSLQA